MEYWKIKEILYLSYGESSFYELFSWGSSVHTMSWMRSFVVPVVTVLCCLDHEVFFCFPIRSEWYKEFFIITAMRSFDEILADIPVGIIAIYICIKQTQYIIPFLLLTITSWEKLYSSIGMNVYPVSSLFGREDPTGTNMSEDKYEKLESKGTTLSSWIWHESGSTGNIDDVPLIDREMLIILEILIHSFRKTLLISEYLGVKVHIPECSYGLVVIEWSFFPIFGSHLLDSQVIPF